MGLYTNPSLYNGYTSSDYTSVEPFRGEHFNYHELGIIAASESAANRDAFMKAIALNELASVEQYGTDQVFYESVNLGGIFEKIKAFFKKIIEKIHKIFHTFIAKLSSWFQSSKDFAKKYEKEIIKKWGLVKSDWEFKGYIFKYLPGKKSDISAEVDATKNNIVAPGNVENKLIKDLLNNKDFNSLFSAIGQRQLDKDNIDDTAFAINNSNGTSTYDDTSIENAKKALSKSKDNMESWKEEVRGAILNGIETNQTRGLYTLDMAKGTKKFDSEEYTDELFKVFRSGQDSKVDVKLSDLGSATEVVNNIKDFDKIKEQTEKLEKAMVKSIDDLINAISKAQDDTIKKNKDEKDKDDKKYNEFMVSLSAFYQSCWGFIKEAQTQAFGACIQALKDRCAQDKEVCVKVIGSSKKMTEESYDYSNDYSNGNNFNSFIESVKLV